VRQGLTAAVAALALAGAGTQLKVWAVRGAHVVVRGTGSCSSGSLVDRRADAWRCRSGGGVYDPCFSDGAFVLCPDGTPDSHDALQVRLTKPLPRGRANPPGGVTSTAPWVIVTAAGTYCYRQPAATYQCAGAALVVGLPKRTGTTWTIGLLPTSTSKHAVTTAIRSVWW